MDNTNSIYERRNPDGSIDYIVNFGNVLYNDKIIQLANLTIPLKHQKIFNLPEDKNLFAVVNIYYSVSSGTFIFETVKKSSSFIEFYNCSALANVLPVGQFIVQQSLAGFEVKRINTYSKMATFSITTSFDKGDIGSQGPFGETGFVGYTGLQGDTGTGGSIGLTGARGETGVGVGGHTGPQGVTGIYPDESLLLYCKFKNDVNTLIDYSMYERDFEWGATGAGVTGIVWLEDTYTDTGLQIIDQGQSSFTVEDGIVDNCHRVDYIGGISGYDYDKFIGFTGTISAWVNADIAPIANFSYEVDSINPLKVVFRDESLFYPTQWEWDINGLTYGVKNFTHTFGVGGEYIISLIVRNSTGENRLIKAITV